MKQSTHFRPEHYGPWTKAQQQSPTLPGWYECQGWRFSGFLHLYWDGTAWLYFGPAHPRPDFPSFGQHETDEWRGLVSPDYRQTKVFKSLDITGQRFGRLVAIERAYITRHGAFWMFQCDCGARRVAQQKWVTSGNTASCGCLKNARSVKQDIQRPWGK